MRLPRYAVVSGLSAVLNNLLMVVLVSYGFTSTVATALVFGPVLLLGYALHSTFTFGTQPCRLSFARYALAMAANLPLWVAALWLLCELLRVHIALAAPATTVLMFLWNYLGARWAFFTNVAAAPTSLQEVEGGADGSAIH